MFPPIENLQAQRIRFPVGFLRDFYLWNFNVLKQFKSRNRILSTSNSDRNNNALNFNPTIFSKANSRRKTI